MSAGEVYSSSSSSADAEVTCRTMGTLVYPSAPRLALIPPGHFQPILTLHGGAEKRMSQKRSHEAESESDEDVHVLKKIRKIVTE